MAIEYIKERRDIPKIISRKSLKISQNPSTFSKNQYNGSKRSTIGDIFQIELRINNDATLMLGLSFLGVFRECLMVCMLIENVKNFYCQGTQIIEYRNEMGSSKSKCSVRRFIGRLAWIEV